MNVFKLSLIAVAIAGLSACSLEGDDGQDGVDGAAGADGSNGVNSLTVQTELAVGDANCPNSGVRIDSGLDNDSDGTLAEAEITSTSFVCVPGVDSVGSSEILTSLNNDWFVDGQAEVENNKSVWMNATSGNAASSSSVSVATVSSQQELDAMVQNLRGTAKNVILFVGDGMGISTVTAARILDGQMKGLEGEENQLSFDAFPFSGLSKTYNVDAQTPDSAGTMTAMMSGIKTDVGVIGVDEDIERGDCSTVAGNELVTALELAEIAGKSTGIISTARITHATPAATYAKSADRNWEDISDMPEAAVTAGCSDIADQLINFEANLEAKFDGLDVDGIEVVMGGGRRHFLPRDPAFNSPDAASSTEGDRTDGRDLTAEWQSLYTNGVYVFDQSGFDGLDTETTERVFGLFNESHMQYEADRGNDIAGEPSVAEMTSAAIKVLDNNDEGFFLMVESGRIDHAHHAGNAYGALHDTIAFAEAVAAADELTNDEDTLIIVTADHGHVFTIAGYPKRGNPILGKVVNVGSDEAATAADGTPYTTLGYTNGLGYRNLGDVTNSDASYLAAPDTGRKDITDVDTTTPGYHQEALVPLSSETHSGEDVGIYAKGPGAFLVNGTNEQSVIFHVMDFAGDYVSQAESAME
ncbi:alkaline phosphatase [Alteromonas sp.]|uniref:alkaline phosphatase n=1 Tax=Alteromonas sp. TaxID=232 RepID=UPI000B6E2B90|nr:alkaline phosphatase [Alteromonas sp.]MAI37199.1 alkaline phosphatase [Alteromonas sp.]OUX89441.1 MAG: alkaline phosphatase [Alteromonas sp. TMED35]|tara:strand:- start:29815 stop:31734 length:1920 start_codon:yes stop_codon:yes gene_type:complete